MNVMNLLLYGERKKQKSIFNLHFRAEGDKVRRVSKVPLQDAHGRLSVLNQAHSAVTVPLVLDGDAAYLHHHVPQLFGRAPTLFRAGELFAC